MQRVVYVSRWTIAPVDLVNDTWRCNGTVSDESRLPGSCDHVESVVWCGALGAQGFPVQEKPRSRSGEPFFYFKCQWNILDVLVFAVSSRSMR